jgi:hypothetical protein
MFETLYKTKTPIDFPQGEYYQPAWDFEIVNGAYAYFVREKHGYWNDTEKRMANQTVTLSPEEGYSTLKDAEERYNQQIQHRVAGGFVHSFYFDPMKKDAVGYRCLS